MKPTAIFFGSSFLLHLLWENLQAPLYAGYTSFSQHFWICFNATFGDLLVMLMIYLAVAIVHQDIFWARNRTAYARPITWVLLLLGLVFAIGYEWWAVYVVHRWAYGIMPLIPVLNVGLAPVLQMVVVPIATLFFCSRFASS